MSDAAIRVRRFLDAWSEFNQRECGVQYPTAIHHLGANIRVDADDFYAVLQELDGLRTSAATHETAAILDTMLRTGFYMPQPAYDAVLAALWRPIEYAPKDGAEFLAWWGKPVMCRWLDNSNTSHPWAGWHPVSMVAVRGQPTHFILISAPPPTSS